MFTSKKRWRRWIAASTAIVRVRGVARHLQPSGGLWDHADFMRLWGAQSMSLLGTQVTMMAIPLVAVIALNASAFQMGLLAAAGTAPFLLLSLLAGVWTDRRPRRPVLVATDYSRAVLLLSIPLAAGLELLTFAHLYVVAFVVGALGVFFEVAHYAYVPTVVGRDRVIEANSKLQISYSAADSAGPGLAGLLIELVSAPFALVVDALSFIASGALIQKITSPERSLRRTVSSGMFLEVRAGLRALMSHPLLRPILLTSINWVLFESTVLALFILYATRDLGIAPIMLGLIFVAGGVGAIPGALLSGRIAGRFGFGPAIIGCWFVGAATLLVIPFATEEFAVPVLAAAMLVGGMANTVSNIQQWSLRQIVTPDELQGRVTASHRFLVYGAMPVGGLLGGMLGNTLGLQTAILIGAAGVVASPLWALFSPLRELESAPAGDSWPGETILGCS